jgi:hypothetical protein
MMRGSILTGFVSQFPQETPFISRSERRASARQFWQQHIKAQSWSGQTVAEYCLQTGISAAAFCSLRRRLPTFPVHGQEVAEVGQWIRNPLTSMRVAGDTNEAEVSTKHLRRPAAAAPRTDSDGFGSLGVISAELSAKQDPRSESEAGEIRIPVSDDARRDVIADVIYACPASRRESG